jgi:hypothetical protein
MEALQEGRRVQDSAAAARLLPAVGGYEQFKRSFDARSHFPERLAERTLEDAVSLFDEGTETLLSAGASPEQVEEWQARFVRLWGAYQHSGARVMNWFITGPANFPVERNRKRMEVEQRRGDEFLRHARGAAEWMRRRARSAEKAALSAQAAEVAHPEKPFPGGRLVQNTTLDRVQLVFDGKPDPETIALLKSRAFRWSPREGAWQRQLTRNGMWAAEAVVAALQSTKEA